MCNFMCWTRNIIRYNSFDQLWFRFRLDLENDKTSWESTVPIKYKRCPMSKDNHCIVEKFPRVSFIFIVVMSLVMQLLWISALIDNTNGSLILLRTSLLVLSLYLSIMDFHLLQLLSLTCINQH